ncbi:hypothetical protein [Methylobacterium sp. WL19]|uniref:hypothetical protein n=1 Tax=Methylobacterium sp. WL19 TaxID=2603896 RepID=UPI0011C85E80|nr:hypothetical protein [Methylobacterium sp. WL19]TXN30820.1 hypothetical protein FV220_05980 [Methylobacterium sp. WL19]
MALGIGWVELNLPQLRGPLVSALASMRTEARKATTQVGATVATAPAPVERTEATTAETSLAA